MMKKSILDHMDGRSILAMRFPRLVTVCSLVVLWSSCNPVVQSFKDTFNEPSEDQTGAGSGVKRLERLITEEDVEENYLKNSTHFRGAKQALKELPRFKGKSLNVYSDIHFYDDGRGILNLQDPDLVENIDSYTFRDGKWLAPTPVRVSSSTALSNQLLSIDSVDFATVTSIYNYMQKQGQAIEGAEDVNHIYLIIRPRIFGIQWYASLQGARGAYSLRAQLSGEIIRFERD